MGGAHCARLGNGGSHVHGPRGHRGRQRVRGVRPCWAPGQQGHLCEVGTGGIARWVPRRITGETRKPSRSPGLVSFSSSSAWVVTLSDFGEWIISTTEPAQLSRHPNLPKMLSFSFRRYEAKMDLQLKK